MGRKSRAKRAAATELAGAAAAVPAAAPRRGAATAGRRAARWRRWLPPVLVLLVAAGVYANTLTFGFTWDDSWLILDNHRLTDPSKRLDYIEYMFTRKFWRPLKRLSLMADYALWMDHRGTPEHWSHGIPLAGAALARLQGAAGFHLTNLLFQSGACLALYSLVLKLASSRRVAALAALFFAVHPLHTEAVANISHRKEPMSLLFYLLAFLAYLAARSGSPPRWSLSRLAVAALPALVPRARVLVAVEFVFYTLFLYLCAFLSLEVGAVMFPATVVVYELAIAPGRLSDKLRRLGLLALAFAPLLVLFWNQGYLNILGRFGAEQIAWVTGSQARGYGAMLLIAAKAFATYAGLLVWPSPLYLDRAFAVPVGVADPGVIAGLLLVALLAVAVVVTARRQPLACFALAWYGLNLLPVLNVVPLTHWLVAERFAYVPSVGFALLLALGVEGLWSGTVAGIERRSAARAAAVLATALVLVHGALTVKQSRVWKDSTSLWTHTLRYNPGSHRGQYGLGLELDNHGQDAEGEQYYRRAIALAPRYPEARYALAFLLLKQKRYEEAITEARVHSRLVKDSAEPLIIVGNARLAEKRYGDAVEAYAEAIERDPSNATAHYNLANARQLDHGFDAECERYYRRAIELAPHYPEPHYSLALLLLGKEQYDEAIAAAQIHARLAPANPEPFLAIGNARFGQKRFGEAAAAYAEAIRRNPGHAGAARNLVLARQTEGTPAALSAGLEVLEQALRVRPDDDRLLVQRGSLLEGLGRSEDAIASYRRAAERTSDGTEAVNALVTLLLRLGRSGEALPEIERSLAIDPDQPGMKATRERLRGGGSSTDRSTAGGGRRRSGG